MFRVWQSDRALLRCDFLFWRFAACLRARVFDTFSEVAIPLTPELEFRYSDPRGFPEDAATFKRGLVIFFPSPPGREPDNIAILELIERPPAP